MKAIIIVLGLIIISLGGVIMLIVKRKENPKAREKRLREAKLKREMLNIKEDIDTSPNN
jgi:hypothetical protein